MSIHGQGCQTRNTRMTIKAEGRDEGGLNAKSAAVPFSLLDF